MADTITRTSNGGQYTGTVAAATAGVIVASGPGILNRITVTGALGTAAVSIYDNASAASGTILFTVAASQAVGSSIDVQMPFSNGIYVGGTTNTPALTVAYSKSPTAPSGSNGV